MHVAPDFSRAVMARVKAWTLVSERVENSGRAEGMAMRMPVRFVVRWDGERRVSRGFLGSREGLAVLSFNSERICIASGIERVRTPSVSKRLDVWMMPSVESMSRDGLKPMMPDFSAGETIE